jgi:hypothetical protein
MVLLRHLLGEEVLATVRVTLTSQVLTLLFVL